MNSLRLALLALLSLGLLPLATRAQNPSGAGAGEGPPPTWKQIESLIADQRFAEALAGVERIQAAASGAERTADWTRALLTRAELRAALGQVETGVEELRRADWPADPASRAALSLHLGGGLRDYLQTYSWEIRQRERVAGGREAGLARWSAEEIADEAVAAFAAAWHERAALGRRRTGDLPGLVANSYPREVRGTLRDSLSYLVAELLADTSLWSPAELSRRWLLDAAALASDVPPAAEPDAAGLHPLARLAAVLADLEAWHRAEGRPAAELEARLERHRLLHAGFEAEGDRAEVREALARRLPDFRRVPWWSEGMATLSEMVEGSGEPGSRRRARDLAREGVAAHPGSPGARHCASRVAALEAPSYELAAMRSDAPGRRSVEITHANLDRIHLRAYRVDLEERLRSRVEGSLFPRGREVEELVERAQPVAAWQVALPGTPDLEPHRTYVTPPLSAPGAYLLVASARPDFARRENRLRAAPLLLTDLVLQEERQPGGTVHLRAVEGGRGRPAAGARVALHRLDWRQPPALLAEGRAGEDGALEIEVGDTAWRGAQLVAVGRHRGDLALLQLYRGWQPPREPAAQRRALLFTDRALYRPGQPLFWKVLVYEGEARAAALRPVAGAEIEVALRDPNGERVAAATVTTNEFGTGSGELRIPAGRPLGDWQLLAGEIGSAAIGVEEYKRPTFEVEVSAPPEPLRLNRPAELAGEARYLFGLPVAEG
ncbi:MAG TPA: MG2 domain-containing protein, partial [Thermoanaerobaculia bacterium]|nr:MG2 domain-containing protein [Thermoanaerobaculia bacterium]